MRTSTEVGIEKTEYEMGENVLVKFNHFRHVQPRSRSSCTFNNYENQEKQSIPFLEKSLEYRYEHKYKSKALNCHLTDISPLLWGILV